MTRFDKVEPKEPWSAEKTKERIDVTMASVRELNTELNDVNSRLNELNVTRTTLCSKLSRKNKYINQLRKQLDEKGWVEL